MPKREFRRESKEDVDRLVDIVMGAYPGFMDGTPEERTRLRDDILKEFDGPQKDAGGGLYEDGELIASCKFHRFDVNVRGTIVPSGGLGGVCVALDRKKEKACRDMMGHFLGWCAKESRPLAMLYPFNPAFYRRMGYGFGTKMHRYSVPPAEFPAGSKGGVRMMGEKDAEDLLALYNAYAGATHGMVIRIIDGWRQVLKSHRVKVAGFREGGRLTGYVMFVVRKMAKENPHKNHMSVRELVHVTPAARSALLAFLRSQSDQFRRVELNVQDEMAHHWFADPRDGSDEIIPSIFHSTDQAGVGLMYKVHDPRGFFASAKSGYGPGELTARFVVQDTFDSPEPKVAAVKFHKGRCEVVPKGSHADIEVAMGVAPFSSMAMGCVPLSYCVENGLAEVDRDRRLAELDAVLRTPRPPLCLTVF